MPSFPALQNDLLLKAARQEATPRAPVWMMRQAGRYLPEYRALRSEDAFFSLVRTPELAMEVTLQPLERFPLDAAIIFSDILVIPQAMGMDVEMIKGRGPVFKAPLASPSDMARLRSPDLRAALDYVFEALTLTRHKLAGRVPLIGFCGAPWTLMAYMIEGSGSKTFSLAKTWLFRHPDESRALLQDITDRLVEYLSLQIQAGAQLVQVFDTWAGLLSPEAFNRFCLPYLAQIAERLKALHPEVPATVFAKGAHYALDDLADTGYDVIGLDWTMDPRAARRVVAGRAALQGNLDPCVLYADPMAIRRAVRDMLDAFGPNGHIANLGHGMHPDHDPAHAAAFIEAVQEISAEQAASLQEH
ncbi:MAG: uroporphyrinogen decarboxylase [Rhodothermales bacterium]